MSHYPWFEENLDQWLSLVLSQQAPSAILLCGINGLGKYDLAKLMAHNALCENLSNEGVCNQCSACELYKVGNHPDLTLISAEKSVIKVDQIRKLSKDIRLTSTKGQYRVVIIENAEKMNKASANALLKTLEEPPSKVIIILTTSEVGRLLQTIKSRCVKINCELPNKTLAIDWLNSVLSISSKEIDHSLLLANGSPLIAKEILENNTLGLVKVMLSDLNDILNNQKSVLEVSKKWHADEQTINLPFLAAYFVNLLKFKNGLLSDESFDYFGTPFDFFEVQDFNTKITTMIKSIYMFSYRLETALKKELLLEELLICWKAEFKL